MTKQPHQKSHTMISMRLLLLKSEYFPSLREEPRLPHLKDFLKYKCKLCLKQPMTPSQRKIIVAYHTSNHRLAIQIIRWRTIPISRDNRLCHFCSNSAVEKEPSFVLECALYNPIRDKFPSLFENVVLGSLWSFFQLDHEVGISLYLMEATALRHSSELPSLKAS